MLETVLTALPAISQTQSIRRPPHVQKHFIFSDREDLSGIVSLAAHHPDFPIVGSAWYESDACPVRRPTSHRPPAELSWRWPEHRDCPHTVMAASFHCVGEQLCAIGKPRKDSPVGAGCNSGRPWDEPLFTCRKKFYVNPGPIRIGKVLAIGRNDGTIDSILAGVEREPFLR